MKVTIIQFLLLFASANFMFAQPKGGTNVKSGEIYTLEKLSQEKVTKTASPQPNTVKEVGDTTFTFYKNSTVELKLYFVNGPQYDAIFNPNPTGLYVGGKPFVFYCGIEMSHRQNISNFLDVSEFSYLGKKYLYLLNFREDCAGEGCRYRCYNLFDITDPKNITQTSFSSVYEGAESFGEFNSDGSLDFVRVAPIQNEQHQKGDNKFVYLLTSYSFTNGQAVQLKNSADKHPYYLKIRGDEEAKQFEIVQADWFFSVKDTSGKAAERTSYYAPYISFDPMYQYLYDPDGVRIEKNRWVVYVTELNDLEAAQEFCRSMMDRNFKDVYIMLDQYGGQIKFQILMGNFVSKDMAVQYHRQLQQSGLQGEVRDLTKSY